MRSMHVSLLVPFVALPCHAGVVTLLASQDAAIYQSSVGDLANGSGQHFFTGNNNAGLIRRSMLAFDVSTLQPGWTITGVTLTLHFSFGQSQESAVSLHRALSSWSEGPSDPTGNEGAGASSGPGDATWLHRSFSDSLWSTPGGDFEGAASATSLIGGAFGLRQWTGSGLIADVQGWLDGSVANHGWFLRGVEDGVATAKRFDSRDNPDEAVVPRLTIEYLVPAPAAWMLLAFGVVGRRRRQV